MNFEFSRIIELSGLENGPVRERFAATPEELAGIAERLSVPAAQAFEAAVTAGAGPGGAGSGAAGSKTVALTGTVRARLRRQCVVSLEEFETEAEASIDVLFVAESELDRFAELEADPGVDTVLEPLPDAGIDVGEQALQTLLVALDPYPRSAGTEPRPPEAGNPARANSSPFAVLAGLRDGKEPGTI